MASTSSAYNDAAASAQEQIRQLRDQVDGLMRDRVNPAMSDAASRARDAAGHAQDFAQDQFDAMQDRVREMPLAAILVAAAVGYVIGRFSR